jgi:hypothetical protein
LLDLVNAGDIPLPQTQAAVNKRTRDDNQESISTDAFADTTGQLRPIASSKRFQAYQQAHSPATSSSSQSESSNHPSISVASSPKSDQAISSALNNIPPAGDADLWSSSSSVTTLGGNAFEPSMFTSTTATGNGTFEPAAKQQDTQLFPALDENPSFPHDFSSNTYLNNSTSLDCSGSSSYALPLNGSTSFGAIPSSESDTLAMWSFAPSGFE